MEITIKLENIGILSIGGGVVLLALVVGVCLLLRNKGNPLANTLLSLLLMLAALTLLNDVLAITGIYHRFQHLYFIPIYYTLSIGPLAWLYVQSKIRRNFSFSSYPYLHLILPLIQALVYFSIGFRGEAFKDYLWTKAHFRMYLDIESLLFPCSLLYYFLLSKHLLARSPAAEANWEIQLHTWLWQLVRTVGIVGVIESGFILFSWLLPLLSDQPADWLAYVHQLVIASFVLFLSLKGYEQLFPEKIAASDPATLPDAGQKELLTPIELKRWSDKVQALFEEQKLYRNPDLNIEMLSKELAISGRLTSYILNHGLQKNFAELLNTYRTREVINRLANQDHKRVTILSIAFDAGFESKSTFYRHFKTITGLTPSQYITQLESPKSAVN